MARRKRQRRLLDYDDLLLLLRDALVDPASGEQAARRVRERYRVVLVDEFQDTDPVQWQILRTAFHGHRTLVLIGDPKQAVYAFRGGDVVTYLAAGRDAATTATLERNWRSDADLIGALARLMRGAALGDDQIVVRPVRPVEHSSAASTPRRRLDGAGAPLRIRQVRRAAFDLRGTLAPRVGSRPRAGLRRRRRSDRHHLRCGRRSRYWIAGQRPRRTARPAVARRATR